MLTGAAGAHRREEQWRPEDVSSTEVTIIAVLTAILLPLQLAALCLIYDAQRIRKEIINGKTDE